MPDLREQLTMLRDLGVRTAHFGADGALMSVTFGDGGQEGDEKKDDDEDESPRMRMARAAAGVLTGRAPTLEKALEAT